MPGQFHVSFIRSGCGSVSALEVEPLVVACVRHDGRASEVSLCGDEMRLDETVYRELVIDILLHPHIVFVLLLKLLEVKATIVIIVVR
jgi:hypothetical protein